MNYTLESIEDNNGHWDRYDADTGEVFCEDGTTVGAIVRNDAETGEYVCACNAEGVELERIHAGNFDTNWQRVEWAFCAAAYGNY